MNLAQLLQRAELIEKKLNERSEAIVFNVLSIAPYLAATGDALVNLDENKTGADDFAGQLLIYSADVMMSFYGDGDLPDFPEILKKGVTEKISGVARVSLIVASSILSLAQFQFTGRAAKILKYTVQAIRLLLAGEKVPTPPADTL